MTRTWPGIGLAVLLSACSGARPAPSGTPAPPEMPAGYSVTSPSLPAPTSPEAAAATKGRGDAAFLSGAIVFRGSTAGLVVGELLDDGTRYEERSVLYLRDAASDVVVKDGVAFVASGPQGVTVVDVSDPRKPVAIALVQTPGAAVRLELRENNLLIADGSMGVAILDVSTPKSPLPAAAWRSKGYVKHAIFADDGTIYVAEGTSGVTRLAFDGRTLTEVWRLDTAGEARAVCLRGGTLFVADGPDGIAAIDVSGAQPKEIGRLPLADMARDVEVTPDGAVAFVASGDDGVITVDLTKPAAMAVAGALPLEKPVNRVRLYGQRLVIGNDSAGLGILDVSNPDKPVRIFPASQK
jgi:hypothetical protein